MFVNPGKSLVAVLMLAGAIGCEAAPPADDPTKVALDGTCSCTCQVHPGGSPPTWNNEFTGQPDERACSYACNKFERSQDNATCTVAFTRRTERMLSNAPPPDADFDGLPDSQDKCPREVGPESNGGCPETPPPPPPPDPNADTDHDGVVDSADRCPRQPETKNGYQDDDGCPDEVPLAVQQFAGTIDGIVFVPGSADIDPKSFVVLNKAADVFRKFPDVRVEISGHTDNVGNEAMNTNLSRRRAESVKAWFVKNGVVPTRLVAVGHGPTKPIADNKTKDGKAKNRRVEFKLVQ
jgi:outer membrane protein OmpA-like peptidoglycan-associated protein